jgi:hypothetical protein
VLAASSLVLVLGFLAGYPNKTQFVLNTTPKPMDRWAMDDNDKELGLGHLAT